MSAPVIDLTAYRTASAEKREEMLLAFKPGSYPDNDFRQIAGCLKEVATSIRLDGMPKPSTIARLLDGLSNNAMAACNNIRAMEAMVRKQERKRAKKKGKRH